MKTATVQARVKTLERVSAVLLVEFTAIEDTLVSLSSDSPVAPADGATLTPFSASLSRKFDLGSKVNFTTTNGLCSRNDKKEIDLVVNTEYNATGFIRSPETPGSAVIAAKAGSVSSQGVSIQLQTAYPDVITLSIPNPQVATGAFVNVTADFFKEIGKVSAGQSVLFSAFDDTGGSIGSFRNQTVVSAARKASAEFFPGQSDYRGLLTIVAEVPGSDTQGLGVIELIDAPD